MEQETQQQDEQQEQQERQEQALQGEDDDCGVEGDGLDAFYDTRAALEQARQQEEHQAGAEAAPQGHGDVGTAGGGSDDAATDDVDAQADRDEDPHGALPGHGPGLTAAALAAAAQANADARGDATAAEDADAAGAADEEDEDGDEEDAAPPPAKRAEVQCEMCQDAPAKYKCPGCGCRTCSLACSKAHKVRRRTRAPCLTVSAAPRLTACRRRDGRVKDWRAPADVGTGHAGRRRGPHTSGQGRTTGA